MLTKVDNYSTDSYAQPKNKKVHKSYINIIKGATLHF